MHEMNDMLHMWNKLNHINLFINVSSHLLKNSDLLLWVKKNWILVYKKKSDLFLLCKKKVVFREKIQIYFYLVKQSLLILKKYQIYFLRTKKKRSNLFWIEKMIFWWLKKIRFVFMCKENMKMIFFFYRENFIQETNLCYMD